MPRPFYLLLLLTFCQTQSLAQNQSLAIYFDSDSCSITPAHKAQITKLSQRLAHQPFAYEVKLTGHTDSTASYVYNKQLSIRRVNNAKSFLQNLGFEKKHLISSGHAFTVPSTHNLTPEAKRLNRRVEMVFSLIPFETPKALAMEQKGESFEIQVETGAELTYNGSTLFIPANAFVDANGQLVTGNVKLDYIEFRNPLDFVNSGVPMSLPDNGELGHFHSSGMFNLKASQNGNDLQLAQGKAITMHFVVENTEPGTNFYRFNKETGKWEELYNLAEKNQAQLETLRSKGVNNTAFVGERVLCYTKEQWLNPCDNDCRQMLSAIKWANRLIANDSAIAPILALDPSEFPDLSSHYNMIKKTDEELRKAVAAKISSLKGVLKEKTPLLAINPTDRRQTRKHHLELKFLKNTCLARTRQKPYRGIKSSENAYNRYLLAFKTQRSKQAALRQVRGKRFDSFYVKELVPGKQYELLLREFAGDEIKIVFDGFLKKGTSQKILPHKAYHVVDEMNRTNDQIFAERQKLRNKLEKIRGRKGNFVAQRMYHQGIIDSVLKLRAVCDSAQCFYQYNQKFALGDENDLGPFQWGQYFDTHHGKMQVRFDTIAKSSDYQSCQQAERQRLALVTARAQIVAQNRAQSLGLNMVSKSLIQELKIDQLGMYNADAVKRIANPKTITPEYTLANGTKLKVTMVHLFDNGINGVISYNGYMNYSPYKMVYGVQTSTKMLVVAMDGNVYLYDMKANAPQLKGHEPTIVLGKALPKEGDKNLSAQLALSE